MVVDKVLEHIHTGHNFLLSGGAGSGKTYALVKVLEKVIEENPHIGIACITYTNTAVDQITARISHDNLRVSTIHDFLWDNMQQFQNELQSTLLERIRDDEDKNFVFLMMLLSQTTCFHHLNMEYSIKKYCGCKRG